MKEKYVLNLNSITDLSNFISEISTISCDVDASFERHCVDAKSLMGVMSLSCNPVTVKLTNPVSEHDKENFARICEKYEIKE